MSRKSHVNTVHRAQKKRNTSSLLLIGGLLLIAVAVLVMVWISLTPNRGNGGTPQLQVSAERLDLGRQIFNRPIRASFTLKNTGNVALTLNVPRATTALEGC